MLRTPMPEQQKRNQRDRKINILSLNVARSNVVAHESLQIASTHNRKFDIMLHQEPWWGSISAREDERGEARSLGWTVALPTTHPVPLNRRPRVLAYFRTSTDLVIVQRTDIIENLDIQILDVKRHGAKQRVTRLINIYNAPDGESRAVDELCRLALDPDIPTIIMGDWNLKHPLYRAMPNNQNPNERAVRTSEWLTNNKFDLQNEWNQETWCKYGGSQVSALDFTFQNQATKARNILQNWSIERELNAGSDHYATFATLGGGEDEIVNLTEAKYNWKGMDAETFTKTLSHELHADSDRYDKMFGPLIHNDIRATTPTEIDAATDFFQSCMTAAAAKAVPLHRSSPHAKPWWTPQLTEARRILRQARSTARDATIALGYPDEGATRYVTHCANVADRLYKKTKRHFYEEVVKNATATTFWEMRKWTTGSRQYPSPPLSRGVGADLAITHADKCNVLRAALLPPPPILTNPPVFNLEPSADDAEWTPVTLEEVRTAIFQAKANNAPGISGMTGAAYRQAWKVASREIFLILSVAAHIGHHPKPFRKSICVVLRKPKKPDYSLPNAYHPIQLLEVLGKALERIQADRLSYWAVKLKAIPSLHFGGVKGKSAEDAVLVAVHDIQAARNHGLASSSLTFDISGFFNNVSHPVLLADLRAYHFPLPTVRWVASFLNDRQTAMCLDGTRDVLLPTETGTPQGSGVSCVGTAILTASLTATLNQGLAPENLDAELADDARMHQATKTTLIIYVDDGKITIASSDINTNVRLLSCAYQIVNKWMTERGMKIDPIKRELIHHSWRRNDRIPVLNTTGPRPFPPPQSPMETPVVILATDTSPRTLIMPTPTIKWLGVTFDSKLTFHKHIADASVKAIKAINSLNMIGNSIRGLPQIYRRYIVQGAILPMLLYASPSWYNGTKTQSNPIQKVQNRAMHFILGTFRTTPIHAMQIEASLPPARLLLDYMNNRKAIAANHHHPRHPVAQRLPDPHRSAQILENDGLPFQEPCKPIGARVSRANRARLETKNAQCTHLWKIGRKILTHTEKIDKFTEPPWHRVDKRVVIEVPRVAKGKSPKESWAKQHKALLRRIMPDEREVRVYSDGSLYRIRGVRRTGCGGIAYRKSTALFQYQSALGPSVEIYDAEMEGLARGAEALQDWIGRLDPGHNVRRVRFLSDNTGALQRIYRGTPGLDQARSSRFRNAIHDILDNNPLLTMKLTWVPGHSNIIGNDVSDRLAKRGAADTPASPGFISAAFAANTYKRLLREAWQHEWRDRPASNNVTDYTIANTTPPTLGPTKILCKLDRKTFSRVLQCRTGHAHIGSYYSHMGINEPSSCPCGARIQSRAHVLLDCERHEIHHHLLANHNNVVSLNSILGSGKGIQRLATFIAASHAFDKPPSPPQP